MHFLHYMLYSNSTGIIVTVILWQRVAATVECPLSLEQADETFLSVQGECCHGEGVDGRRDGVGMGMAMNS